MAIPAGQLTREMPSDGQTLRLPVKTSTTITKGDVVIMEGTADGTSASYAVVAPTTPVVNKKYYVALETVANSGASGSVDVAVARANQFVTATIIMGSNVINPGDTVKTNGSTAGRFSRFVPGTDDNNLMAGIFCGIEGGSYGKSYASANTTDESLVDTENFLKTSPTGTFVGEVLLL